MIKYMSNGKVMIIFIAAGLIKKMSLYKMIYFSELYTCSRIIRKVELDLSNYAKKLCNRRQLADLVSLKLNIDKLDISKLEYHVV